MKNQCRYINPQSSSWINDASGNVNQYLAYTSTRLSTGLHFGELRCHPERSRRIDQRAKKHDIRFKFTGKERDAETGYTYFGARYYASDLSVWLSVDPLASRYPSQSPYSYVGNRPIMVIDPNGMNEWIPPTEKGGDWTAEPGDSPGSLARDAGISQTAAEGVMRDYNKSKGNKRSSDIMVYTGDKVSIPGGGEESSSSSSGATSSTVSTATATPSSSSDRTKSSADDFANKVRTARKANDATGIVLSTAQATMQFTRAGSNLAYTLSNNRMLFNGVNNGFKYAPYVGFGVNALTGYYLSTSIDPLTNQPYQSWAETGSDLMINGVTIYIGAEYGGWYGAATATFYVGVKLNVQYQIKEGLNPGMLFIINKE